MDTATVQGALCVGDMPERVAILRVPRAPRRTPAANTLDHLLGAVSLVERSRAATPAKASTITSPSFAHGSDSVTNHPR
ncbi:hypothetical protein FHU38_000409 [Saccharomonospora amisosensis]|uniref:Uncharacterized protein n=1 Tax=Saccharomonospora amisosensis TaxID=1128677 RepID=A0A7X5ULA4_9PSEU|nr:hypothetical protein [Saccharomonospora amisosensis]